MNFTVEKGQSRAFFHKGEMLEWLKRHAWKACKLQKGFRGSNPRLSATKDCKKIFFSNLRWCMCIQRGGGSCARAIPDEEHEDRTAEFIRKIHLN